MSTLAWSPSWAAQWKIGRSTRGRGCSLPAASLGGKSQDPATRDAVRRLSRLFYQEPSSGTAASTSTTKSSVDKVVVHDLPCLCSEWVMVPGMQAVLHVHAPHDVHMLNALFASHEQQQHSSGSQKGVLPTFGFLYAPSTLANGGHGQASQEGEDSRPSTSTGVNAHPQRPGGSEHTGSAASCVPEQQQGSGKPLLQARIERLPASERCGCIVETTRAVKLSCGRFLLLVTAVSRMRVLHATQVLPYLRADIAMMPDEEEVRAAHATVGLPAALQAAHDAVSGSQQSGQGSARGFDLEECPVGDVACQMQHAHWLHAAAEAAHAAAVASAHTWQEYEYQVPRSCRWPEPMHEDPSSPATSASVLVTSLVDMGVVDIVALPGGGAVLGSWDGLQDVASIAQARAAQAAQSAATAALRSPGWDVGSEAVGGAQMGSHSVEQNSASDSSSSSSSSLSGGVTSGSSSKGQPGVAPEEEHLDLERQIWEALDALAHLSLHVNKRAMTLPMGLLQLRPPPQPQPNVHHSSTASDASSSTQAQPEGRDQHQSGHVGKQERQSGDEADAGLSKHQHQHQHQGAASEGMQVHAERVWPAERRVARLSYAMITMLTDPADPYGRQRLLAEKTAAARLRACLAHLRGIVDGMAAKRSVLGVLGDVEQKAKGGP